VSRAIISHSNQEEFYQPNLSLINIYPNRQPNTLQSEVVFVQSKDDFVQSEDVFRQFEKQLTNPAVQLKVLESNNLLPNNDQEQAKSILSIHSDSIHSNRRSANTPRITIELTADTAATAAKAINEDLIPLAANAVIQDLETNHTALRNLRLAELKREIRKLEARFIAETQTRVKELQDHLALARIQSGTNLSTLFPNENALATALISPEQLETRINQLKGIQEQYAFYSTDDTASTSEKPYISEVTDKVLEIKALQAMTIDYSNINPVNIEQPAAPPLHPKSPKKALMAGVGFILGGMIGVFIVLIQTSLSNRRKDYQEVAYHEVKLNEPARSTTTAS
ncbi:MAG: hypothetical protein ACPG5T_10960, partial [Endozoicomonas sp.]